MIFLWKPILPGILPTFGTISGFVIRLFKLTSTEIKNRLAVLYIIHILHDRIAK